MNKPIIIGICGRSCSGKGSLTSALASVNREVLLLQADYYFNGNSCNYKGYHCIEHIDSIDNKRLISDLKSLKEGKDTSIYVSTPWLPHINLEVSSSDIKKKNIIIVEGYLLFVIKELVDLMDYKIFVDISDYNLLKRRLLRDGFNQFNYIIDVIVPVSKEYEQIQKENADVIIDGNKPKQDVIYEAGKFFNSRINQRDVSLPSDEGPYQIHFGDIITDYGWHPIDFKDLKDWVKQRKNELDIGEELKGHTFRYRKKMDTKMYEIRLGSHVKPPFVRYTKEPT